MSKYVEGKNTAGTSITTHIGSITNTGAMAVGSSGTTQHVTVGIDPAAMSNFVQMLLRELPQLHLGEKETPAREALEEVRREVAKANPDQSQIVGAMGRVVQYVSEAGKPVLTALFMLAAQGYGLPAA